jgi:iron complex transport system substrate-binding protein
MNRFSTKKTLKTSASLFLFGFGLSLLSTLSLMAQDRGERPQNQGEPTQRPERPAQQSEGMQRPTQEPVAQDFEPITLTGRDGVETTIDDVSRIVTIGGSVTEIVYALGFGPNIAGTDITSTYPRQVFRLPRLGALRQSSAESILSLDPSVVITTSAINPPAVAQQVRDAGVPVLIVDEATSVDLAKRRINDVGEALRRPDKATDLITNMETQLAEAAAIQKDMDAKPSVLFIYTRGAAMVNVSGKGTGANAIVELAGGQNVITQYEGYRPLTAEAAVSSQPDIILAPSHGVEMLGGMENFMDQPGLKLTPAAKNGHVRAVDTGMLLSFGPRLGEGVLALTRDMQRMMSE